MNNFTDNFNGEKICPDIERGDVIPLFTFIIMRGKSSRKKRNVGGRDRFFISG